MQAMRLRYTHVHTCANMENTMCLRFACMNRVGVSDLAACNLHEKKLVLIQTRREDFLMKVLEN